VGSKAESALDPVADLVTRLAQRRGGTGQRALRTTVDRWWVDHELAQIPAAASKRVAVALLEQQDRDAQHAGVVVLGEKLADDLRGADLAGFAKLFSSGCLADGTVVDAFAIKVLGTLLHRVRGRQDVARALAAWRAAEYVWQRRAVCVAFTALAPQGDSALDGFTRLALAVCATIVWSPDRVDQTAVGWLLCELSRAEPTRVEAFVRRHARFMSREGLRHSIDRFSSTKQAALVAHWKRATTLRK
jgi:3-methyladenine DNA glycosylase AlkD